jgi:hypothetical protein
MSLRNTLFRSSLASVALLLGLVLAGPASAYRVGGYLGFGDHDYQYRYGGLSYTPHHWYSYGCDRGDGGAPIPEPTGALVFAAGALVISSRVRRRRR